MAECELVLVCVGVVARASATHFHNQTVAINFMRYFNYKHYGENDGRQMSISVICIKRFP